MPFRIRGLAPETFTPLFALSDAALAARDIRRITVEEPGGTPCRISLADAEPGEQVLLMAYEHQPAASPFRASGPIFVRHAVQAFDSVGVIPPAIAARTISARAYDAQAMMTEGELVAGAELEPLLRAWFARPEVESVHLHYARRGCYAALAERSV